MTPALSIIIPTHKRPEILRACLECIERQTIVDQIEVIVVSDGEKLKIDPSSGSGGKWKMDVRFFDIPKSQQGVARNRGVQEAQGKYLLFIGDDIFLAPDACEKHLDHLAHVDHLDHLVLGFTTWDPLCGITRVMRWLERTGWQFGYSMIKKYSHQAIAPSIQHCFTYTSHISLPREIAKKFPFRDDVTMYGWEDIEWGLRLRNAGMQPFYEPDAKALHHHHIELEDSLKRMEMLGKSAVVMDRLVPELQLVPTGSKLMKYRIAAMLPGMRGRHARSFLKGIGKTALA